MTNSDFVERLTGRRAPRDTESASTFAKLIMGRHVSDEEQAIALLVARVEALSDEMNRMPVRERLALAESLNRGKGGKRTQPKQRRRVSEARRTARPIQTAALREYCSFARSGMCGCSKCISGHCPRE